MRSKQLHRNGRKKKLMELDLLWVPAPTGVIHQILTAASMRIYFDFRIREGEQSLLKNYRKVALQEWHWKVF